MNTRMHSITVIDKVCKRLVWLLLPLARGFYYVLLSKEFRSWLSGAWLDLLVVLLLILFSYTQWRSMNCTFTDKRIIMRSGFLMHAIAEIPLEAVTTVTYNESIFLRPFGAVRLCIDTDGGSSKRTDVNIILSRANASLAVEILVKAMTNADKKPSETRYDGSPSETRRATITRKYQPRWFEVAFLSLCVTSALGTAAYAALFLFRISRRIGRAFIDELWLNIIKAASFVRFIPTTLTAAGIIILAIWVVAFVRNYLYYMRFTVERDGDVLHMTYGFLTRNHSICRISAVNCVDLRQTVMSRLLGVSLCAVRCTGYGKRQKKLSILIPAARDKAIRVYLMRLLPEFARFGTRRSHREVVRRELPRYIMMPLIGAAVMLLLPTAASLCRVPSYFLELMRIFTLPAAIPFAWLLILRIFSFARAGVERYDNHTVLRYDRGFMLHTVIFREEKLDYICRRQSIFQRRRGTKDMLFYTYGDSRYCHKVRGV